MSQIDVSERTINGCLLVTLSGELNITSAPELRVVLMKHVKGAEPVLALDMSGLEFMDTSGLATLIEAHLKVEEHGGRLALFGLQSQIAEVFEITRVTALFTICNSQQEALDALNEPGE